MCSVVGYIGRVLGRDLVLDGLAKTEYRGYDSAGFVSSTLSNDKLVLVKSLGVVSQLREKVVSLGIDGYAALGHTRWATHGGCTEENAHPHCDCKASIAVAHNGIIENYLELKHQLIAQSHRFISQTDTEVIAHLWESLEYDGDQSSNPREIIASVVKKLDGAYALVVLAKSYKETIFFARNKSPLCIGLSDTGYWIIASDILAFDPSIKHVFYIPDKMYGYISLDEVFLFDHQGVAHTVIMQPLVVSGHQQGLNGYSHYMIKEVYEQKAAVLDTVNAFNNHLDILAALGLSFDEVVGLQSLKLLGCGASWHAGRIAQFFFEEIAQIPTAVHLASEFRYMKFFPQQNQVGIIISQSGETADALEALRLIKSYRVHTIGLVNVATSSMVREADGALIMHAGPEVAVASTKAFVASLASLYWLAHYIAFCKGLITQGVFDAVVGNLDGAVNAMEAVMNRYVDDIKQIWGPFYAQFDRAICLGRHISYPFALEAALKFKEIDYIFAQCYPAGELKHGPLALIDAKTPVFVFSVLDPISYQKLLSNVQEAKARGAHIVAFVFEGQDALASLADTVFEIPLVVPLLAPIAMNGVMLLLVCAIGLHLGFSIDKPRNLAKSVTVE